MIELYNDGTHSNYMVNNLSRGGMADANQHLIVHDGEAMLLDPGGHKVFVKLQTKISRVIKLRGLKYIFFSHQDPDIVAAANAWLLTTDADALLSTLWMRFITHFGVDTLVTGKIRPIDDDGMEVELSGVGIKIIPAHFLHSAGNFQVYDPVSKILYSGDLGASLGVDYAEVTDFDAHAQVMLGFHQRYIPCGKVLRIWAATMRQLDIEIIAPQHGAVIRGRDMVERFFTWIEGLECGVDRMGSCFPIP